MSVKVAIESSNLAAAAEQAAQRATEIVLGELSAAFDQAFTANAWDWPRDLPTRRLSGATLAEKARNYRAGKGITPPNPRNTIDTGNLRQTGSWEMIGPYQAIFKWSAEYATAVHEGATIRPWGNRNAAPVRLPARPWTRAVLGQENVDGIQVYNLGERLQNVWLATLRSRGR
jgi:hypothetical protein